MACDFEDVEVVLDPFEIESRGCVVEKVGKSRLFCAVSFGMRIVASSLCAFFKMTFVFFCLNFYSL